MRVSPMLKKENVILGEYFNFTMGTHEIWGPNERVEPVKICFSHFLQATQLVDLDPIKLNPT